MTDINDIDDTEPTTVDDARERVEQTRNDLAGTLGDLTDKLDLKKQATAKAGQARAKLQQTSTSVAERVGRARDALPPPIRRSVDATTQAVAPAVSTAVNAAKTHRRPVLLAATSGLVALLAFRRWRRS